MEACEARLGRLFVLRFQHGDDLIAEILAFARREGIKAAWLQVMGALHQGQLVVGPLEAKLPPVPVWQEYSGGWELLGIGNLFWEGDQPKLHLHGASAGELRL